MIYPDRANGIKLVTDPRQHSIKHAPTEDEGKRVYQNIANTRRGDRYIKVALP